MNSQGRVALARGFRPATLLPPHGRSSIFIAIYASFMQAQEKLVNAWSCREFLCLTGEDLGGV